MTETQIKHVVKKLSTKAMLYTVVFIAFGIVLQQLFDNPINPAILFGGGIALTLMVTIHLIQIAMVEMSKLK